MEGYMVAEHTFILHRVCVQEAGHTEGCHTEGHVIESAPIAHWQPCGGNRGIEIIDSRGAGMR